MFLSVQYMAVELTLSCPAAPLPAATILPTKAYVPPCFWFSLFFIDTEHVTFFYFPNYRQPGTTMATPTTTLTTSTTTTFATIVAPASADQQASSQQLPAVNYPYAYAYSMPWYFPYSHPRIPPLTSTTTTPNTSISNTSSTQSSSSATTTTVAPASADQQVLPHWLPAVPYPYGLPWYFPHIQPGTLPVATTATTTATTTSTSTVAPASADQQALPSWFPGLYNPSGYGMQWNLPYSQPGSSPVAPNNPLSPGMFNTFNPIASPDIPVSASNSGVKQQMYSRLPWFSFSKNPTLNQKPGSLLVNPSKVVSYPAYVSPLQVKGAGK